MSDSHEEESERDDRTPTPTPTPPSTPTPTPSSTAADSPTVAARKALEAVRYEESPDRFLEAIATASDADLTRVRSDQRTGLAFWLNCYNATAQLLLDRRPELYESQRRFFGTDALTVGGVELSLDDIEHGIVRGNRSKYGLGYLPRLAGVGLDDAYRLGLDPRIHFALNCGAASCPAILSYDSQTIDRTLDDATRSYLDETVEYDASRDRVLLPRVCLWFVGDFGGRSGLRELVREFEQVPPGSSPSLRFASYDWTKLPRQFRSE